MSNANRPAGKTLSREAQAAAKSLKDKIDQIHKEAGKGWYQNGPRSRTERVATRRTKRRAPGQEFFQPREFQPRDDPRLIMARKSAGLEDQILTKVTLPETDVGVFLLLDCSRTLDFGFSRESKLWLLARAAVTVCQTLKTTQDHVRPLIYANKSVVYDTYKFTAPLKVSRRICAEIIDPVYSTGRLDSGLLQAMERIPRRGGQEIVIMSDFLNLTEQQKKALMDASRRDCIRALVIQDERERVLPEPPSWFPIPLPIRVFDLHDGQQYVWWTTRSNRRKYTEQFIEHEERLRDFFETAGIRYDFVNTNEGVKASQKVASLLRTPPLHR